jgi:hypothetical protein
MPWTERSQKYAILRSRYENQSLYFKDDLIRESRIGERGIIIGLL